MSETISVAIVGRIPALTHGLAVLFGSQPDMQVTWSGEDHEEALQAIHDDPPTIVLLDLASDEAQGWYTFERMVQANLHSRIVVLADGQSDYAIRLALSVSAVGYLLRCESLDTLVQSLRRVSNGGFCFSSPIQRRLKFDTETQRYALMSESGIVSLTSQQINVLKLLAEGASVAGAAGQLGLSAKSVDGHKCRIMRELGVGDRVGLARLAIREGLVSP